MGREVLVNARRPYARGAIHARTQILSCGRVEQFMPRESVIAEGDNVNEFYILLDGQVSCAKLGRVRSVPYLPLSPLRLPPPACTRPTQPPLTLT